MLRKLLQRIYEKISTNLAVQLDRFVYDYDFYHYMDNCIDREENIEALKYSLCSLCECRKIVSFLRNIIKEESYDEEETWSPDARDLIEKIEYWQCFNSLVSKEES